MGAAFPQSECFPLWQRAEPGHWEDSGVSCVYDRGVLLEIGSLVLGMEVRQANFWG